MILDMGSAVVRSFAGSSSVEAALVLGRMLKLRKPNAEVSASDPGAFYGKNAEAERLLERMLKWSGC